MDYPKKELAMLSITALTSLYLTNTESVHASETITPAFSLSTTNSISSTLEIPYQIIYHEDASLEKGQEVVIVQGVLGLKDELGRIIKSPINKVVILGTKETKQPIDDANIINPPVNNDPKGKDDTPTSPVNNDPKGKDDTPTSPVNNDPKGKDDTPTPPVNNVPKRKDDTPTPLVNNNPKRKDDTPMPSVNNISTPVGKTDKISTRLIQRKTSVSPSITLKVDSSNSDKKQVMKQSNQEKANAKALATSVSSNLQKLPLTGASIPEFMNSLGILLSSVGISFLFKAPKK
ncbi:MAG: G5 domain-containing protein [Aerococcus sanguinicola]|nr:hypothetical protein F6I01_09080 [Aerococcus sanguinicola]